jgi:hypothetical protein
MLAEQTLMQLSSILRCRSTQVEAYSPFTRRRLRVLMLPMGAKQQSEAYWSTPGLTEIVLHVSPLEQPISSMPLQRMNPADYWRWRLCVFQKASQSRFRHSLTFLLLWKKSWTVTTASSLEVSLLDLSKLLDANFELGLYIDGSEEAPIVEEEIIQRCHEIKQLRIEAIVTSEVFSPI